jgi:uncharacterized LabA/DUF88 family protein
MATESPPERVIGYVDGFNLYFGLKEKGWRRYFWLDVRSLIRNLLKPAQHLVGVKYFTARISGARATDSPQAAKIREAKRQRQSDFLDALATAAEVQIFEGHYLDETVHCFGCKRPWIKPEEKMTDVQIATQMLADAFEDRFDTALLVSGDSDLVPPIRTIGRLFPKKRVVVAFPPRRKSGHLKRAAAAYFTIGEGIFRRSQFPERITLPNGHVLSRPRRWR